MTEDTPREESVEITVSRNKQLRLVVQQNIDLQQLHIALMVWAKASGRYDRRSREAGFVLGRAMVVAQQTPELYPGQTFEQYCEKYVYPPEGGYLERSQAWAYKLIAERHSGLTIEELLAIPLTRLLLISRFTNESASGYREYLEAARTAENIEKLRDWLATKGQDRDSTTGASVRIAGSLGEIRDIQRFLATPEVKALVGTVSPAKILKAAIEEFSAERGNPGGRSMVTLWGTKEQAEALNAALEGEEDPIAVILKALEEGIPF